MGLETFGWVLNFSNAQHQLTWQHRSKKSARVLRAACHQTIFENSTTRLRSSVEGYPSRSGGSLRELQLSSLEELASVRGDEEEEEGRGDRRLHSQKVRQEGRSPGRHRGLQADRPGCPHYGEVPAVRLDQPVRRIDGEEDRRGRLSPSPSRWRSMSSTSTDALVRGGQPRIGVSGREIPSSSTEEDMEGLRPDEYENLLTDNGKQFCRNPTMRRYCEGHITGRHILSSIHHPQTLASCRTSRRG